MSGPVDNYKYRELWASTPGARHRYLLQLRWWLLPEIPTTPLRGSAIDVFFKFRGGCCRRYQQHLPRGPPSTSSLTSVVAATGDIGSTPKAPPSMSSLASVVAADGDTSNTTLGGPPSMSSSASVVAAVRDTGSTPRGVSHRRVLQLQWWLLPEIPVAPPRGPAVDVFFNFGGGYYRYPEIPVAPPGVRH
jgi:hypothetical protein